MQSRENKIIQGRYKYGNPFCSDQHCLGAINIDHRIISKAASLRKTSDGVYQILPLNDAVNSLNILLKMFLEKEFKDLTTYQTVTVMIDDIEYTGKKIDIDGLDIYVDGKKVAELTKNSNESYSSSSGSSSAPSTASAAAPTQAITSSAPSLAALMTGNSAAQRSARAAAATTSPTPSLAALITGNSASQKSARVAAATTTNSTLSLAALMTGGSVARQGTRSTTTLEKSSAQTEARNTTASASASGSGSASASGSGSGSANREALILVSESSNLRSLNSISAVSIGTYCSKLYVSDPSAISHSKDELEASKDETLTPRPSF